jgi:tRNA (guanine-N7-)-methyltransferase
MTKRKLERFEEMKKFSNVLQPAFYEVFNKDYKLKGKWKDLFGNDNPIILELGCGKGEYTVELASRFKQNNYIGIDIKGARIWKGAKRALEEKINNAVFLRTRVEFTNSFFDRSEVDEIWITFPDPQPKNKKKRLTSSRFLNLYANFLKPGGPIHLKTDNALLYEYTFEILRFNGLEIEYYTDNLYDSVADDEVLSVRTFYEKKFLGQGMKIYYLKFRLDGNIPVKEVA